MKEEKTGYYFKSENDTQSYYFINENDIEEKVWLFETLLTKEELILHSNDIGESIGTITSIKAYEIKTDVEEVKIINKENVTFDRKTGLCHVKTKTNKIDNITKT